MAQADKVVVVVGGGFGGLNAARALRRAPANVVLVDRNNYHLFQPLLYQVATAGLEPEEIARPVRAILRRQKNFDFRLVDVTGVDFAQRRLETSAGPLAYDYLVLSHGSETNFFGLDSVRKHGLGLKDIDDAVKIRNRVLTSFEQAMLEPDPERRRAKLAFVVVGGGPTGVEMAGALSELIRLVLVKDYPRLNIKDVRILLLEATDKILATMPERLREAAVKTLWRKWIEVRFNAVVADFDGERVRLKSGEVIPAHTLIWAAGVTPKPLVGPGKVRVRPTLQHPEHDEVFVIGDAAHFEQQGHPLAAVAPVAIQMGKHAALNIVNALRGKPLAPFHYRDQGTLATIGRNAAVCDVYGIQARGFPAWVLWLGIHIVQLIGFRNKLFVLINWAWDYFFYERAARLITRD